jgi:tripartite-type tricarboxylate transporter receptor subunit TctC
MTALLAGQVDLTAQAPGVAVPHIKSGKVRALGGWGAQRVRAMPELSTFREQGYDVEFYIWCGMFAPAGTPPDVLAKIRAAIKEAMQDPAFRNAMSAMDTPINYLEGADFENFLDKDGKRLAEVVRRMGKLE